MKVLGLRWRGLPRQTHASIVQKVHGLAQALAFALNAMLVHGHHLFEPQIRLSATYVPLELGP